MTEFLMFYNEEELGEKLRTLRPEGEKKRRMVLIGGVESEIG